MSEMSKIHIWLGISLLDQESYEQYFTLDYSTEGDFDDPDYAVCGFCKDVGEKWYDEDFLGMLPVIPEPVLPELLLRQTPIQQGQQLQQALEKCASLHIDKVNALFYYTDASLEIPGPDKEFNGLRYIGCYDSILV